MLALMIGLVIILGAGGIGYACAWGRIARRMDHLTQQVHGLQDVLDTSPLGFYASMAGKVLFSRSLCLFFNLLPHQVKWSALLPEIAQEDKEALNTAFWALCEQGRPFSCLAHNSTHTMIFQIVGEVLAPQKVIVWFQDITKLIQQTEKNTAVMQNALMHLGFYQSALNALDVPLKMTQNDKVFFQNAAAEQTDSFTKVPFENADEKGEIWIGKTLEVMHKERDLKAWNKTEKMLIKNFPNPAALFDEKAMCLAVNDAFLALWHLPDDWDKHPQTLESFLNAVQEQALLPTVQNVSGYKQAFYHQFHVLSSVVNEYVYLPENRVLIRTMMPFGAQNVLIFYTLQS